MPERPDLRHIATNVRESLGDCDRETLLDILTFVIKEYLVDGPPPMLVNQVERIPDLEGLSFPDLIRALKLRLAHPELELFRVEGERVLVRAGDTLIPLAAPAPGQPPAEPARPAPGVRIVEAETRLQAPAAPAAASPASPQQTAPRPRGISVRGRPSAPPSGAGAPASEAPAQPAAASQPGNQPQAPAPAPESPGADPAGGNDDLASTRFRLLELD